jgi:hypothetical protein
MIRIICRLRKHLRGNNREGRGRESKKPHNGLVVIMPNLTQVIAGDENITSQ